MQRTQLSQKLYDLIFIPFFLTFLVLTNCTENPSPETNYLENDTLVYLSFNNSTSDQSRYEHNVNVNGSISYLKGQDGKDHSAGFFDGSNYLSLELESHKSLEFDFWFSPYRLKQGMGIMDYMNGMFSIRISELDTTYVDAYGAATYKIQASHSVAGEISKTYEVKPYPYELTYFDDFASWKHIQIFIKEGAKPILYINGFKAGEMAMKLPSSSYEKANILIGCDKNTSNHFKGKIDEFVIRNYSVNTE